MVAAGLLIVVAMEPELETEGLASASQERCRDPLWELPKLHCPLEALGESGGKDGAESMLTLRRVNRTVLCVKALARGTVRGLDGMDDRPGKKVEWLAATGV